MYLVAIAWMYVVVMMAIVEAFAPNGTVLGAVVTFVLYGMLPLGIVMYVLRTPARKAARLAREQREAGAANTVASTRGADASSHPAGEPVAPVGEKP